MESQADMSFTQPAMVYLYDKDANPYPFSEP
jgi:hypothetical protein